MTPFRRDGHLTDLALDALVEDGGIEGSEDHLASCAVCRSRLEAAAAVELPANLFHSAPAAPGLPLGASQFGSDQVAPATQTSANRPWAMLALVATAAVALLVAGTQLGSPMNDGLRIKGSGLSLQVFRDQGDDVSERLHSGDAIAAGDRLGFRVRSRDDGHLMIVGIDARDEAYLCYPQGRDGDSMPIDASNKPLPLPEAIRMDPTPGTEQLIAVVCDESFSFDEMAAVLLDDDLPAGCTIDEVDLEKR